MGRDAPWLPPGNCIVPGPKVQAGRPDRRPKNPTSRQLPFGLWCSQNAPSSPSPSPCRRSLSRRGSAPLSHSFAQYGKVHKAKDRKHPKPHTRFPQYAGTLRSCSDRPGGKAQKAKDPKHPKLHTIFPQCAGTLRSCSERPGGKVHNTPMGRWTIRLIAARSRHQFIDQLHPRAMTCRRPPRGGCYTHAKC